MSSRIPNFAENPPDRCYHCKKELFGTLAAIAREEGIPFVLDGSNRDDRRDFRPGSKAGRELGVRSPLQEAGLTKAEIREISRRLGLPTWDKPSMACLASRFPYGTPIEPKGLRQVGAAEDLLRRLGFGQLRVRHHGTVARIEIAPGEFPKAVEGGGGRQDRRGPEKARLPLRHPRPRRLPDGQHERGPEDRANGHLPGSPEAG